MSLSEGYIYASDVNSLRDTIKAELERRDQYNFTNFNSNLNAEQYNNITASIWNNLINPLNTINANITNYAVVATNIDYIRALIQLSTVTTSTFAPSPYRNKDTEGNKSSCASGCVGLCWGCSGNCVGYCLGCDGCSGCGGCDYTCTGGCAGRCDNPCTGCYGTCTGDCQGGAASHPK